MSDDWRPTATFKVLGQRARLLAAARGFFAARGLLEVETPALITHAVTDPHLANITACPAPDRQRFLHTSPEFHMKRLLAAGAPDIWQLGRVYRAGEAGPRHQPEFTLVEWYRLGWTLDRLGAETCELLATLAAAVNVPLAAPVEYTYRGLFAAAVGIDPIDASVDDLRDRASALLDDTLSPGLPEALGPDRDGWLDLLMSHVVMGRLTAADIAVVRGYPASQAALARLDPADPATAERFEVFCRGLEVANGYRELTDAAEQRWRMQADRDLRRRRGLPDVEPDPALLAALEQGLPDCAGVAVGFDRVVMALLGHRDIRDVISFPVE